MTAARVAQLGRAQLAGLTPREIEQHRQRGALAVLLGGPAPIDVAAAGQLSRTDLAGMSAAQINAALEAGKLRDLLGDPDEIDRQRRLRAEHGRWLAAQPDRTDPAPIADGRAQLDSPQDAA